MLTIFGIGVKSSTAISLLQSCLPAVASEEKQRIAVDLRLAEIAVPGKRTHPAPMGISRAYALHKSGRLDPPSVTLNACTMVFGISCTKPSAFVPNAICPLATYHHDARDLLLLHATVVEHDLRP